jgi:hypothetical protein
VLEPENRVLQSEGNASSVETFTPGLRCSKCAKTPIRLFENDIDGNFTYSFTANKRKQVTTLMQSLDGEMGRLLDLFFFRGGKVGVEFDYFFDSPYAGAGNWCSKTSWVFGDVVIIWEKEAKKSTLLYNILQSEPTMFTCDTRSCPASGSKTTLAQSEPQVAVISNCLPKSICLDSLALNLQHSWAG